MKNIVEFAKTVIGDTYGMIGHSERDWEILRDNAAVISDWAQDFGKIYVDTVFSSVEENETFSKADRQQGFAVWYETLASGAPPESFWAETCLLGLDHATIGVHNRHVIAMNSRVEQEFLKRAIKALDAKVALQLSTAFGRVLSLAVSVMVDSYHHAIMTGMAETGINDRLVKRIRNVAIRRMIDKARELLPLIEWNDSLSVKVQSIDEQHKQLVVLINRLRDSSVSGKGNQELASILNELTNYTVNHFAHEEKIFAEYGYPETEEHIKAHTALVAQVGKLNEDFAAGRAKLTGDLFQFLRNWLNGHIRGTDRRYTQFMLEHNIP